MNANVANKESMKDFLEESIPQLEIIYEAWRVIMQVWEDNDTDGEMNPNIERCPEFAHFLAVSLDEKSGVVRGVIEEFEEQLKIVSE